MTPGSPRDDRAGDVGSGPPAGGLPKNKATTNLTYARGPISVFLQERYVGGGVNDHTRVESTVRGTGSVQTIDNNSVDSVLYTDLTFGYSASATCAVILPIASWTASLVNGGGSSTSASIPAVILPATSYLCWTITVFAVNGGLDLRYDASNQQTSIATPTIVVPEHGSPLIGLAILLPLLAGFLIRRPLRTLVRVR